MTYRFKFVSEYNFDPLVNQNYIIKMKVLKKLKALKKELLKMIYQSE